MEHLIELGVFAGKSFVVLAVIAAIFILFFSLALKSRSSKTLFEIEKLNEKYEDFKSSLQHVLLGKKELKEFDKAEKKAHKAKDKIKDEKPNLFVLDFDGDVQATAVDRLRNEITAILTVLKPTDSVLVRVESPGGAVHGYGLAASQLSRIRKNNDNLIIAVDKVAASGGYMMACVANKIIAAPFAIVGSIGVVAQVPNVHKLLKKHNVDYEEITSGEYKRTVSVFGEITEKGRQKFTDQIEETHDLFKRFVAAYRPQLDIAKVATGEYWFGTQALELKLVDEIKTSDEYLFERKDTENIIRLSIHEKKKLKDLLSESMKAALAPFITVLRKKVGF